MLHAHWAPIVLVVLLGVGSAAATSSAADPTGVANGKAIFQTGIDLGGKHISARPAALRPSCAACHRADGRGGMKLPKGAVSADLRHRTLVKEQPPYSLALLERAISTGVDNKGEHLDPVMPHWQLSKTDLHDVAAYVLTLK
jgi:mono/diheme cytochrome c family protein